MINRYFVSTIFVSVVLLGCSDTKEASKSNFSSAIGDWLHTQKACMNLPGHFPLQLALDDFRYKKEADFLAALIQAELITQKKIDVPAQDFFGNAKKISKEGFEYTLTDKALPFIDVPEKRSTFNRTKLCYGSYQLNDVESFTEPGDMMGYRVSQAIYTYQLSKPEEWLINNEAFTSIKTVQKDVDSLESPMSKKAALVLTNDGWVHEKLFKANQ